MADWDFTTFGWDSVFLQFLIEQGLKSAFENYEYDLGEYY